MAQARGEQNYTDKEGVILTLLIQQEAVTML